MLSGSSGTQQRAPALVVLAVGWQAAAFAAAAAVLAAPWTAIVLLWKLLRPQPAAGVVHSAAVAERLTATAPLYQLHPGASLLLHLPPQCAIASHARLLHPLPLAARTPNSSNGR